MNNDSFSWEVMDELIAPGGPAGGSWFARVHRSLMRRFPDRFVFRLRDDIEDLERWLQETGIERRDEQQRVIGWDEDRAGPDREPENGWVSFTYQERRYDVATLLVWEDGYRYTYTWVICPDREGADLLSEALGTHLRKAGSRVLVFKGGSWEDAPRLERELARYDWSHVVLPEAVRTRVQRATDLFFRSETIYRDLELPWKMGYLFTGPPGTGKTVTTKILASTVGVRFLYVRTFARKYGREANQDTVRAVFGGARKYAPCILCLEDVDSLIRDELKSTFLNELDGLEEDYRGVLTIATTNHPEKLDAALLHRPSRFDYRFEFPLPSEDQRRAFVLHWTEKLRKIRFVGEAEVATDEIVRRSHGMSHAYLQRVLAGVAMRMQMEEERGDEAFRRLALEELADAHKDRKIGRRAETVASANGAGKVGFHLD